MGNLVAGNMRFALLFLCLFNLSACAASAPDIVNDGERSYLLDVAREGVGSSLEIVLVKADW